MSPYFILTLFFRLSKNVSSDIFQSVFRFQIFMSLLFLQTYYTFQSFHQPNVAGEEKESCGSSWSTFFSLMSLPVFGPVLAIAHFFGLMSRPLYVIQYWP